jgi:hypothetical protein
VTFNSHKETFWTDWDISLGSAKERISTCKSQSCDESGRDLQREVARFLVNFKLFVESTLV